MLPGLSRPEGDAAHPRLRVQHGVDAGHREPRHDALQQRQVRAAHQRAMLLGQRVEGTVAEPQLAVRARGLEAQRIEQLAGRGQQPLAARARPRPRARLAPEALAGATGDGTERAAGPVARALDRLREQLRRQAVAAGGRLTASWAGERRYSLAGRPAPGPLRPVSRRYSTTSSPAATSLSRWNAASARETLVARAAWSRETAPPRSTTWKYSLRRAGSSSAAMPAMCRSSPSLAMPQSNTNGSSRYSLDSAARCSYTNDS